MSNSRLAALRDRVRRRLLMHRRPLAAILAAVAAGAALQVLRPPEPTVRHMVVAAHDLPAGATLTSADLTRVARGPGDLPSGYLADPTGEVLASPVRTGESVTDARILGPGLTLSDPDTVAMAVRISDTTALDLVRVGEAVDLIAVPVNGATTPRGLGSARVVVEAVRVLAMPPERPETGPTGAPAGRVLVVEVPRSSRLDVSESSARDWLSVARAQ